MSNILVIIHNIDNCLIQSQNIFMIEKLCSQFKKYVILDSSNNYTQNNFTTYEKYSDIEKYLQEYDLVSIFFLYNENKTKINVDNIFHILNYCFINKKICFLNDNFNIYIYCTNENFLVKNNDVNFENADLIYNRKIKISYENELNLICSKIINNNIVQNINDVNDFDITICIYDKGFYNNKNYISGKSINLQNIYDSMIPKGKIQKYGEILYINNQSELSKLRKYVLFVPSNIMPFYWTKTENINLSLFEIIDVYKKSKTIFEQQIMLLNCIDTEQNKKTFNVLLTDKNYLMQNDNLQQILEQIENETHVFEQTKIFYFNRDFGFKVNNSLTIKKNIDLCILLHKCHEEYLFDNYTFEVYKNLKQNNKNCVVYLNGIPGSKFQYDILFDDTIVKNIKDFLLFVKLNNIKKIFIPAYPISSFPKKYRDEFFNYCKQENIHIYTLIAGFISPMHEYNIKYHIKKTLSKGYSVKKLYEKNNIRTEVYPTYYNMSIMNMSNKYSPRYQERNMKKNFCHISRMTCEKRPLFLIDCFYLFLRQIEDYDCKLYLIGNNNQQIKKYISSKKLEKNIIFLGRMNHDELFDFISKNVDYNLLPSVCEGIPGVVLECMMLGIPTIASNVYSTNEIIEHGKNGILFNYENYSKVCFEKIHTVYDEILLTISKYDEKNKLSFLSAFLKVYNNQKLFNMLSNNCIEYMKKYLSTNNQLDVLNFFDFN